MSGAVLQSGQWRGIRGHRNGTIMWKVFRRVLALFIRVFVWHPVIGLTIVVLALGAIGLSVGGITDPTALRGRVTSNLTGTVAAAGTTPLTVQSATTTAPSPAVDEYIKGMTTFDARLMWDALDQQAIQAMTT